jgi:hypothetical protein
MVQVQGSVDSHKELQEMVEGSVNFSLRLLADGTFEIWYGDYLHDTEFHGTAESFEEAVALLKKALESQRPRRAG